MSMSVMEADGGETARGGETGDDGLGQMRDRMQRRQAVDNGTRQRRDKTMAEVVGDVWMRRLASGGGRWWRSRAMKAACGRESRF
jgi:hypothetical protein